MPFFSHFFASYSLCFPAFFRRHSRIYFALAARASSDNCIILIFAFHFLPSIIQIGNVPRTVLPVHVQPTVFSGSCSAGGGLHPRACRAGQPEIFRVRVPAGDVVLFAFFTADAEGPILFGVGKSAFLPEERLELFDRGVVELDFPLVPRGDGFKGVLDPARRAGPCGGLYRILPDSFRRRSCMKLTLQKRILFSRQGVGSGFNDLDLDVHACAQRSALAVYVGIHKGENDLLR